MPTDNTCGIPGPVSKIVGGATADKYKYTWLAMLGVDTDFGPYIYLLLIDLFSEEKEIQERG